MSFENINISDNLSESNFIGIANCHKNNFPQQFLSRAGIEILYGFYKCHSENNEIIFAASINNYIIGFVLGGKPSYLKEYRNKILKEFPFRFILSLFSKEVLLSAFNYFWKYISYSKNNIKNIHADFYYLSVIAVNSNYKGKMVAANLIRAFEAECFIRGYKGYYLNVSTKNSRAIAFYKKQKMEIFKADKNSTIMIKIFEQKQ